MTAPTIPIIPVTMRKTDRAASRDHAMRAVASIRQDARRRNAVTLHRASVSRRIARNRTGRAAIIHRFPPPTRRPRATVPATPTALSP